ncbi:MAG: C40 family peptidase [Saprospiraceae bacterium]|nr:C40 family peptidase [Saprospiraceae bacterium]
MLNVSAMGSLVKFQRYGVAIWSVLPMKRNPSHTSEQISQLIFGECYKIIKTNNDWTLVRSSHDYYEGWILNTQLCEITLAEYEYISSNHWQRCNELLGKSYKNGYIHHPIPLGARLIDWGGFSYKCNRIAPQEIKYKTRFLTRCARKFLNAPYQWGGRSIMGLDCSGFVQICYAMLGIYLPRDAKDQIQKGKRIDYDLADKGDLAFFGTANKITHVGLLLGGGKIIHCAGQVRIDRFKPQGIFKGKKQTHQLVACQHLITI